MSRIKAFIVNSLATLAIVGVIVALLIPTPYERCGGNPDEFTLKRLAKRYHYFFAKHERSPSSANELAAFTPDNLGPYVSDDSLECSDALDDERNGLIFVQWNANLQPDAESNARYVLAYRVAPETEGRWAVRGDASPVYLSPDEFATVQLVPTTHSDRHSGG